MRQLLSRFALVAGMLTLACATALDEGALAGDFGVDTAGSGGGLNVAGSIVNGSAGSASGGAIDMPMGGNPSGGSGSGGTPTNAFGGGTTMGGKATGGGGSGSGGKASGGTTGGGAGGSATGGKGGSGGTGGNATGGKATGGSATGGGGSASGGSPSTTCAGVPDWTDKVYKVGDVVANTCGGVYPNPCTGKRKFECNPKDPNGLPWCQSREAGVGNGWQEAWVDKGLCQ